MTKTNRKGDGTVYIFINNSVFGNAADKLEIMYDTPSTKDKVYFRFVRNESLFGGVNLSKTEVKAMIKILYEMWKEMPKEELH